MKKHTDAGRQAEMPRSEYSKRTKYYLPKHVARSCANYCRMYPHWKAGLNRGLSAVVYDGMPHGSGAGDPTAAQAAKNEALRTLMLPVEESARKVAPDIYEWFLRGVTEGVSFEQLQLQGIPCGRGYYFRRKRLFYKMLAGALHWYD